MKPYSKILSLATVLFGLPLFAQNVYIDVTTTAALAMYANNLKSEQQKTVDQQTNLQKAQTWVGTQMAAANAIQNKVLRGLSEVNGTLTNGLQVKQIYDNITDCTDYLGQIADHTKDQPQFAAFGAQAVQRGYESLLKASTDITDILASGELNLATAGDRYRLLDKINDDVQRLKLWLITAELNIERAKELGFWKSVNPFQAYMNTDVGIVQNIMQRYKYQF